MSLDQPPLRPVGPYPWQNLERVPRAALRALDQLRQRLASVPEQRRWETACQEVLGVTAIVKRLSVKAWDGLLPTSGIPVWVVGPTREFTALVSIDLGLATAIAGRLLGHPIHLVHPQASVAPGLSGLLAAVVLSVAQKSGLGVPLEVTNGPVELGSGLRAMLEVELSIDSRVHRVGIGLHVAQRPTSGESMVTHLDRLGSLPLSLPLVVGASLATIDDRNELVPGAAWLPGAGGLWIDRSGSGNGILSPGDQERGWSVKLLSVGQIVLGGQIVDLTADTATDVFELEPEAGTEELKDLVLEAPVVVRIELGSVTLPAQRWGTLQPGDTLETGLALAEPVRLRIAGRVVALGELVNVEGELGVRIRELVRGDGS